MRESMNKGFRHRPTVGERLESPSHSQIWNAVFFGREMRSAAEELNVGEDIRVLFSYYVPYFDWVGSTRHKFPQPETRLTNKKIPATGPEPAYMTIFRLPDSVNANLIRKSWL